MSNTILKMLVQHMTRLNRYARQWVFRHIGTNRKHKQFLYDPKYSKIISGLRMPKEFTMEGNGDKVVLKIKARPCIRSFELIMAYGLSLIMKPQIGYLQQLKG